MFEFFSGEKDKTFMEWSTDYSVGSKRIDDDHRGLFDVVNHYYDAVHKGEAHESIEAILKLLEKYIREHFAHEERLMADIGYPKLGEHKKLHAALIDAYHSTQFSYNLAPDEFDADGFLEFLQTWLTTHILVEDHKFAPYVKRYRKTQINELHMPDPSGDGA